ncbi:MAG: hypothetical protein MK212_12915 [Saprospiraceae bacterium]|nr:hypothetical protein [Saprospiraceae bacterium]
MKLLTCTLFVLGLLVACETATENSTPTSTSNNIHDASAGTNVVHNEETEKEVKKQPMEYVQFGEENLFTIQIPKHFTQKREEKINLDLVYFFSPKDEDITFFCIPLYDVSQTSFDGITINNETEKTELTDKMPDPHSKLQREVEFVRIVANDGSSIREYIKDDFMYAGMIFKDDALQEKYQEAFGKFRESATNLTDN